MKTKYLFTLIYRRQRGKKQHEYEEHIVAETWEQAREYWDIEFIDEGVEIIAMKKQVPVISILPQDGKRGA